MLTLSRNVGEQIKLTLTQSMPAGTEIMLQVVEVRGGKVRIGLEANRTIDILRLELKGDDNGIRESVDSTRRNR